MKKVAPSKVDKNEGLEEFRLVVTRYNDAKTYAEKIKVFRGMHSLYFTILDMFLNDSAKLATSGDIFRADGDPVFKKPEPISHVDLKGRDKGIFGASDNTSDIASIISMNTADSKKLPAKKKVVTKPEVDTEVDPYLAGISKRPAVRSSLAQVNAAVQSHAAKRPATTEILEGYWYSPLDKSLPKPVAGKRAFEGKAEFLDLLTRAEKRASNRKMKGSSKCRICGITNGSGTFYLSSDRNVNWPDGYRHYIQKHNVKPSSEFVDFLKTRFPQFANTIIATR